MLPSVNNHLPTLTPPVGFSPNGELCIRNYQQALFGVIWKASLSAEEAVVSLQRIMSLQRIIGIEI